MINNGAILGASICGVGGYLVGAIGGAKFVGLPTLALLAIPGAIMAGAFGAVEGAGLGYLAGKAIEAKTDTFTCVAAVAAGIGAAVIGSFVAQSSVEQITGKSSYGPITALVAAHPSFAIGFLAVIK